MTDIFSATPHTKSSPSHTTQFYKQVAQFQIAEEDENCKTISPAINRFSSGLGKENTDSGYHDMTEDEMNVAQNVQPPPRSSTKINLQVNVAQHRSPEVPAARRTSQFRRRESADFDVSTKELPCNKLESIANSKEDDDAVEEHRSAEHGGLVAETVRGLEWRPSDSQRYSVSAETENALDHALERVESPVRPLIADEGDHSTSEVSSPAKFVLRKKSSLNFASLPAREPLTTKKGMETRTSRTSHVEQPKSNLALQESHFDKYTGETNPTGSLLFVDDAGGANTGKMDVDEDSQLIEPDPESTEFHIKTTTQRLHERITMLGKSNVTRISKSISSGALTHLGTGLEVPPRPPPKDTTQGARYVQGEDDWVGPINAASSPSNLDLSNLDLPKNPEQSDLHREDTYGNFHSTVNLAEKSGDNHQLYGFSNNADMLPHIDTATGQNQPNTVIASYPSLSSLAGITKTPANSSINRRIMEGPLSASKSRFYSVIKSARTIFASSAGVSAQAKLETLSSKPGSPYPDISTAIANASQPRLPYSPGKAAPNNENRISSDRIGRMKQKEVQETQEGERVTAHFEKARATEAKKAAAQHDARTYTTAQKNILISPQNDALDMPPPPPPKRATLTLQSQTSNRIRHPRSQARDAAPKSRPAILSIRVGTASQKVCCARDSE